RWRSVIYRKIFRFILIRHRNTFSNQSLRQLSFGTVISLHFTSQMMEVTRQATHPYTTDTQKVNPLYTFKIHPIYLINFNTSFAMTSSASSKAIFFIAALKEANFASSANNFIASSYNVSLATSSFTNTAAPLDTNASAFLVW